jgi:hypothetical protein
MIGGLFGGTVASHSPGELLRMIFGLVVILAAARMLFVSNLEPRHNSGEGPRENVLRYIIWGLAVGVVSGLTGIGGGAILVPVMILAMGFGIYQAIGTSSIAIAFNAVGGVIAYVANGWGVPGLPMYSLGYIDLLQLCLLAGTSIFSAQWGVKAAHMIPAERLKLIFAMLMIYIGLKMTGALGVVGL